MTNRRFQNSKKEYFDYRTINSSVFLFSIHGIKRAQTRLNKGVAAQLLKLYNILIFLPAFVSLP